MDTVNKLESALIMQADNLINSLLRAQLFPSLPHFSADAAWAQCFFILFTLVSRALPKACYPLFSHALRHNLSNEKVQNLSAPFPAMHVQLCSYCARARE